MISEDCLYSIKKIKVVTNKAVIDRYVGVDKFKQGKEYSLDMILMDDIHKLTIRDVRLLVILL